MSSTASRPYRALRHRDFRRLWAGQLVSMTGTQMQVAAINWHVYLLTGSPLALGFVGLTRVIPIIAFSLWGGILADRYDRRRVMLVTQSQLTLLAATLGAATFLQRDTVWLLYFLNALSATVTAFDAPARQSLVPRLVPAADLPGALSLNLTVLHAATICGPALAGLMIAGTGAVFAPKAAMAIAASAGVAGAGPTAGIGWIYAVNAVSFLAAIAALLRMHPDAGRPAAEQASLPAWGALKDGLRFVFTTPLMVWTMALDFFATFFAGSMSLLPIFADQVLGCGPVGYGLLVAAPALGALIGSVYTTLWPLAPRQGRVFLWSVAAYGVATIVYGLSRSYTLTFIALAGTGLADLVSTVIRQTLRQLITPDAMRGRMTSVNMIFFMGGPQLGEMEAGIVASLFASVATGAIVSVVSGGVGTLAVVAIIAAASPVVRRFDLTEALRSGPGSGTAA